VPSAREHTSAAQLSLAGVLPTEDLRALAPWYGVGRYDYCGQQAVETTAAALAACRQLCSLPVGPDGAAGAQELFEVPGALLLPDRTGTGVSAHTQDGKRRFDAAALMDLSGSCQVRIAEEPALMLANVRKAEEFEAQLQDGSLQLSRARVRVRRDVRGSAVYLTVGAAVPDLAVGTPRALPFLTAQCVMPARVADIVPFKFGGLSVRLADAAGHRVVQVARAVVAIRGTTRAEVQIRDGSGCARTKSVAEAVSGPALKSDVDLIALVPVAMTGAFSVNNREVAIAVVKEAVFDAEGKVRELLATHVWKLSKCKEGQRELATFEAEVQAAHSLVLSATAPSRKRPIAAVTADEVGEILCPSGGVRICSALSRQ